MAYTMTQIHEMTEQVAQTMISMGWLEEGLTDAQLDAVCDHHCPFGCGGDHCYCCPCWEESAGWDA